MDSKGNTPFETPTNKNEKSNDKANFGSLLTQASGAIAVISLLTYFIGLNYLKSYFNQADASWVVPLFTTEQIVKKGIPAALLRLP